MSRTQVGENMLDVRDLIERFEELEEQKDDEAAGLDEEEAEEFAALGDVLGSLVGCDGDHQWRGDWYPVTLVRDSYFEDYAREFAEDVGAIPSDCKWPCTCIDWGQAADELRQDYSSVEYGDETYWYR